MATASVASPLLSKLYSEDLFTALGAENLSDDEKADLFLQIVNAVQTRVFDRVFDDLAAEKQDEFIRLMESEDVDGVEGFLLDNVPLYEEYFEEEAKTLRRELVMKLAS